ncbi:RNA binding protein, heterogenous nuclear RNP-K like protein [Coemansia brasiliensis]|uniref:RNA binding protein, heterogenous nuclear RNP-K like protein n=1 Tax=Coemansia brasiliensis TaxID=2650707 RepID=A0A9W8IJ92_9FUNG|nr:RNA binding protein, heterogenous nuclear RNP-K like protein [Coemansia brasiliensis]
MSEGPKRFSLSDYQSKRGHTKSAESTAAPNEQKSELEELHMLLGTGISPSTLDNGSDMPDVLRTPGASPDNRNSGDENEEGEEVEGSEREKNSRRRRGDKRSSKGSKSNRRRSRRSRRSPSARSRSRSRRRSRSRSRSMSSERDRSRSRHRRRRHRSPDARRRHRSRSRSNSRSRSPSSDKISIRCVFPYEDGGIIIGLRGAHLSKLRRTVPSVDWRISNETNDRQDRILVVKGTIKDIAKAFSELAEHFISQGMHIDYPPQTRGRGTKEVDVSRPFIPIRLLMPHKTCGAIIGQKSETLINTRVNCAARRVYVYRERIADSRERVVEVVGTPNSIAKVMEVLGEQVARTLSNDQMESDLYIPERDGLRKFLSKQGVPRSRVSLESLKSASADKASKSSSESLASPRKNSDRKRSRSVSRSLGSDRSRSRSRDRHRRSSRRHRRRSPSASRSRSRSRSASRSRRRRHSKRRSREKRHSSRRHRSRDSESSRSSSESRSRSRSRSYRSSKRRKARSAERGEFCDRGSGAKKTKYHGNSHLMSSDNENQVMDTESEFKNANGHIQGKDNGVVVDGTDWAGADAPAAVDTNAINGGSW